MSAYIVSQDAEDSCRLLNEALAAHRVAARALRSRRGGSRLLTSVDREQIQRQSTLVRIVSITESFTSTLLSNRVEQWSSGSAPEVQELWFSEVERQTFAWEKMKVAYKKWVGPTTVSLRWNVAFAYADARNAVAHGLGTLTRTQARTPAKRASTVASLGVVGVVPTSDDRIELDDATLHDAALSCRHFIEALDEAVALAPVRFSPT